MKNLIFLICLLFFLLHASTQAWAEQKVYLANSPGHRVALLELYTSEGCSSCPPADRFLTDLKASITGNQQVIPLAFHVTYWDYIGWKDLFAQQKYDERQRRLARLNASRTVYTPQFMLNGSDYRRYRSLSDDIEQVNLQDAVASIHLQVTDNGKSSLRVEVTTEQSGEQKYFLWLAAFENDLASDVNNGENKGERMHHDFVVRELYGPYPVSNSKLKIGLRIEFEDSWNKQELGVAAFLQKADSSEVVQATRLMLDKD